MEEKRLLGRTKEWNKQRKSLLKRISQGQNFTLSYLIEYEVEYEDISNMIETVHPEVKLYFLSAIEADFLIKSSPKVESELFEIKELLNSALKKIIILETSF